MKDLTHLSSYSERGGGDTRRPSDSALRNRDTRLVQIETYTIAGLVPQSI